MTTRRLGVLALLVALASAGTVAGDRPSGRDTDAAQDAFWQRLRGLCGQAFSGRLVLAPAGDETFAGKALVMHVRECREDRVRIPFAVGEDLSRTWILTRAEAGLRLAHDHRHADGEEDPVSRYGGETRDAGTAGRQDFHADAFTAELIPAASTNVWSVEVEPGRSFVYALERRGTDRRFRVEFDLARPVAPPPAPWGWRE